MVFSPVALHDGDDDLRHQRDEPLFAFGFQRQARTVVLVAVEFEGDLLHGFAPLAGSSPPP